MKGKNCMRRNVFVIGCCLFSLLIMLLSAGCDKPAASSENTNSDATSTTAASTTNPPVTRVFDEDDFRTDITVTLDKDLYAPDETIEVTVSNLSDENIQFGYGFEVWEKDGDKWIQKINLRGYKLLLLNLPPALEDEDINYSQTLHIDLNDFDLQYGKNYKLVQRVGNLYMGAEFATSDEP